MLIEVYTQYMENYGYRWKMKGGDEYLIEVEDSADVDSAVAAWARENLFDNNMAREYVLGWSFYFEDFSFEEESESEYLEYVDFLDSLEDNLLRAA